MSSPNARQRLIEHDAEHRLFTLLVAKLSERGSLKKRGIQRTDSTHVRAAVHLFHRAELLGETLRAALNEIATKAARVATSMGSTRVV